MRKHRFKLSLLAFMLIGMSASFVFLHQLPVDSNHWFTASGGCVLCHSTSTYSMLDSEGNDVSPIARWRGTMLANASKDPFWKAKVKHEGLVNPQHREVLENVCTRCHAPMGMLNAFLTHGNFYTLDSLANDPLGKDGISCTLCHQIDDFSSPDFSGNFTINDQKIIYGPYENPLEFQMFTNSGYTPQFGAQINESRLCGACHSLFTHSVDEYGVLTGKTFVEQALYHEWENSMYGSENISCQSCHMPRIYEPVKISSRPGILAGRTPYGIHDFTGGNYFMLSLLKDNHDQLELHSGVEFLEKSIQRTLELLTESTIDLTLDYLVETNDSIFIEVALKNKAGHKFPTGFPSRRAYLEFIVSNDQDTLFHSGKPGSRALVNTNPLMYEPHYTRINQEDQVQIYEFVMGDTQGKVTTVLERAYAPLKDNRIVPMGFGAYHSNYDTVRVVGRAEHDTDYFSGLGTEKVIYALSKKQVASATEISVRLHYETVPENWLHEMFSYASMDTDIDLFRSMYRSTNNKQVLIAAATLPLQVTTVSVLPALNLSIFPNPTNGRVHVSGLQISTEYALYSINGKLVQNGFIDAFDAQLDLRVPPGTYVIRIRSDQFDQSQLILVN